MILSPDPTTVLFHLADTCPWWRLMYPVLSEDRKQRVRPDATKKQKLVRCTSASVVGHQLSEMKRKTKESKLNPNPQTQSCQPDILAMIFFMSPGTRTSEEVTALPKRAEEAHKNVKVTNLTPFF